MSSSRKTWIVVGVGVVVVPLVVVTMAALGVGGGWLTRLRASVGLPPVKEGP